MKPNLRLAKQDDPIPTPVLCKQILEEYRERQKEVVAGPLANQHQEIIQPRLDPDHTLKLSIRLTDEEKNKG
jgi:hypothetical protein